MTERWEGRPIAEAKLARVRNALGEGTSQGLRPPQLVSVHWGLGTPFQHYLRQQQKIAEANGIGFRSEALAAGSDAVALARLLETLGRDPSVDAVLVEHPLPEELDFHGALARLPAGKDVDGVGVENLGRLIAGRPIQVPAVALAAISFAEHYGGGVAGKRVTVLGRSATVGLPLALLLLSRARGGDATVTLAHSRTRDLSSALRGAELIFSCVGHPGLLSRANVPEGASVVDVGLSSVPDPSGSGRATPVGDVDMTSLDGWAAAYTPVPGGVGPVTVAQLMENVLVGWRAGAAPERR